MADFDAEEFAWAASNARAAVADLPKEHPLRKFTADRIYEARSTAEQSGEYAEMLRELGRVLKEARSVLNQADQSVQELRDLIMSHFDLLYRALETQPTLNFLAEQVEIMSNALERWARD